ncbi:TPA: hypothetical protein HA243_06025, partial [Candidatus Micrarchaeota archaeon]|nr:hypothetical protein [Candidatus Micrarchaeota archaeon]
MQGWCKGSDNDTDNLKYWWAWYKNGTSFSSGSTGFVTHNVSTNVANITGSNLVSSNWTLECEADDGTTNTTALNSSQTALNGCTQPYNMTGQAYTLNENLAISGSTCISVGASGINFNCDGFTITGNNTTGTYGFYTTQFNT